MNSIVNPGHRKIPIWALVVSCLVAIIILFSPMTALALNLQIDPSKISLPGNISQISDLTSDTAKDGETVLTFIIGSSIYTVNGAPQSMDVSPTIIEGRTLLPIRFAAEPLGAEVGWDGDTRKATVSLGTTHMEFWIGQSNALVNGKIVPIDADNPNVQPLIISGRTMLPLRFVTENLGCGVQWDQATQKVTINKTGSSTGIGKIPDLFLNPSKVSDISKVPGQITLKPDLKSNDTTVLKNTWAKDAKGKEYPVTLSEADIPVVMRVGCGYNVFDKYASADSIKQEVLDINKLITAQRVKRVFLDEFASISSEGRTIKEYSESMSVNASAGGSFMGFGGSVKTNFSSGHTNKTDQYFATHSRVKKLYDVYVTTPTAANLKPYLTTQAKDWLNNKDITPTAVFGEFGHYVLVDSVTGGRLDINITANAQSSTDFENFSISAKAEFNILVASASASGGYSEAKNWQDYQENRDLTFYKYGGAPIYESQLSNPQAMANWENSLLDQGTMVDFGKKTATALIPIWDFCDHDDRKAQLKKEFDKLNLAEANKWPTEKYVTKIHFVSGKDKWETLKNCPGGYQLRDIDLNEGAGGDYIYLTFLRTEIADWAFPPITDLFMEYSDKEPPDPPSDGVWWTHNANHARFERAWPGPIDGLNTGAMVDIWDKKKHNYIYLWITCDETLPPIKDIQVVLDDPDSAFPGWETVCWQNTTTPADANKGTLLGKKVYIKFHR